MQRSNVISKSCSFFDEMLTRIGGGGGGGVGGGDNVAEWSVCRTQNRVVPVSGPVLTTSWICFSVAPCSDHRSSL